mmetsp:Transcript_35715/g.94636  ORF Transcript_35715/g.94636 Transcript_35715/m.94636 type:complete len:297 (-) Transcript_35715:81-971(-)
MRPNALPTPPSGEQGPRLPERRGLGAAADLALVGAPPCGGARGQVLQVPWEIELDEAAGRAEVLADEPHQLLLDPAKLPEQLAHRGRLLELDCLHQGGAAEDLHHVLSGLDLRMLVPQGDEVDALLGVLRALREQLLEGLALPHEGVPRELRLVERPRRHDLQLGQGGQQRRHEARGAVLDPGRVAVGDDHRLAKAHGGVERRLRGTLELPKQLHVPLLRVDGGAAQQRVVPVEDDDGVAESPPQAARRQVPAQVHLVVALPVADGADVAALVRVVELRQVSAHGGGSPGWRRNDR